MRYQDTWLNGQLVERGYRPCQSRYIAIREFCRSNLQPGFTVLDIGANMGYFSIRLIEDFNAASVACEFHQYARRAAILAKQRTDRLLYWNRKISLSDLAAMKHIMRFDLLLCLSVLHHVSGEMAQWITAMRSISRYTIVELALTDSRRTDGKMGYSMPTDVEIIGYGESHLRKGFRRPMFVYRND